MTREDLIKKAVQYAEENAGRYPLAGQPKFRESATVYFRCQCDGNEARIEIQVDTKTGECIHVTFIPSESSVFLDDYMG
jgi:hypothetical protein